MSNHNEQAALEAELMRQQEEREEEVLTETGPQERGHGATSGSHHNTSTSVKELARVAFVEGFKSSGEGWNGEYPYEGYSDDAIKDETYDTFLGVWTNADFQKRITECLEPTNCEPKASGWRDIESAPRDGTFVLFANPDQWSTIWFGMWDARHDCWQRFNSEGQGPLSPTHWQPLPPPPGEEDLKVIPGSQPHQKAGVTLVEVGGCLREIDAEIAPIVSALNLGGVATTASCSGHGNRPGNIILSDGRELIIAQDYEEARLVEGHFPNIHGAWEVHTNPEEAEWSLSERRWNIRLSERLKAAISRIESIAETHPELDLAGDIKFYREVDLIEWPFPRTGDDGLQALRAENAELKARYAKLEAAAREVCEQLKSLAYASHKATGRPLSKRPRTKMLQRPEKVRDNLLAVRKALRSVVDGGE
jgi:hypothetical protein